MAFSLGRTLAGAGVVAQGQRAAEQSQHTNMQQRLANAQQMRQAAAVRMAQQHADQMAANAPDLSQQLGAQLPMLDVSQPPAARAGLTTPTDTGGFGTQPVTTPPPLQVASAPTREQPQAGAGLPTAAAQQPAQTAPSAQVKQIAEEAVAQMTPAERRILEDRLALLTPIAIAGDALAGSMYHLTNLNEMAAAAIQKYGGRAINAIVGREVVNPDVVARHISTTPAQDALAKLAAPLRQPTAAGKAYDNAKTPLADQIRSAAESEGIDPVIFKRLIGTESSFDPNAVSPSGKSFGLGIGQISKDHGLTDEQRKDPTIALPKAAQIFKQYLDGAKGNYYEALMRYKGASSAKGRSDMHTPAVTILAGTQYADQIPETAGAKPGTQTAAKPEAAKGETPAQTVLKRGDFYLTNNNELSHDMQMALSYRQELAQRAKIMAMSGDMSSYNTMLDGIHQLDGALYTMQGMQGLSQLAFNRDPRLLARVLSNATNSDIAIQPRSDGTYNVLMNGQLRLEAQTVEELSDAARRQFDQSYVKMITDTSAARSNKVFDTQMDIEKERAKQVGQMVRESAIERIRGQNQVNVEKLKIRNPEWKVTRTDDGVFIYIPGDGMYLYNTQGNPIEIDGVAIPSNSAVRVGGLPQIQQ